MADDIQNYGNHTRWFPPWHFFVAPVLAIQVVLAAKTLIEAPSLLTVWLFVLALATALGFLLVRWMVLMVQNRLIRLEETLRLEQLMPDRRAEIEELSVAQLIAIRFASDAEVPRLLDRIASGEIGSRDEIKRAVQHWRPDHLRA
jgi:hypothetical protein